VHDEGQWRDCAGAGIPLPLPRPRLQSKGKTQDPTIYSLFLYVKERTTSEARQAPYDLDGESILQLIKIPEHGRHLSTAIERVDHALLLVYQTRSCRGDYMLGSMDAGWGVAWETLDRLAVADGR
jgi:hypothetical protein